MAYRFLEHSADVKFRLSAKTKNSIFEEASKAFSSYVCANKVKRRLITKIELEDDDLCRLLYQFLDELIYLVDAEHFIVSSAKVKFDRNKLTAKLIGDDARNYALNHLKAATYSEMYFKKLKLGWEAQVVLDA